MPDRCTEDGFDGFVVLNLATSYNIPQILPSVYFGCCQFTIGDILDLALLAVSEFEWSTLPVCPTCTSGAKVKFAVGLTRLWEQLPLIFNLPVWPDLLKNVKFAVGLTRLWEQLPLIFNLPVWPDLLKNV
ncbi:hypothetical protein B0H10DRAFT_1955797 [Mycena sp. CBHHK59/15]|nr:hypothetical protein B0H10DRAFT_1955797 [Mycena sp. CBHHK59/15]